MILVTGATGTNGVELIRQLSDTAERVRALVRDPAKAAALLPDMVELARGDLDDAAALDEAMADVEKVFLLCPVDTRQVRLEANVVEAAERAGARHLVKFSVLHASEQSPSALLRWHGETERRIRESGLAYSFLRPNMFMQELLRQAASIRNRGEFYLPLGEAKVSLVDVRDNAAVAAAALTQPGHEGKTYNVTGPAALSFAEVAEQLSAAVGKPVRYVAVPMEGWKQGLAATGAPQWMVDVVAELYATFDPANAFVGEGVRQATGKPARTFAEFAGEKGALNLA